MIDQLPQGKKLTKKVHMRYNIITRHMGNQTQAVMSSIPLIINLSFQFGKE